MPTEIFPAGNAALSTLSTSFTSQLATDGIGLLITDQYGGGLGRSQKYNFAPRLGFAYQASPKLVVRGGFGVFYNGFENRGYSPNLGESYPFQFNSFHFFAANDSTPRCHFPACSTAGPGGTATFETGFSCTPLSPSVVNANGLAMPGIQFDYKTPYSMGGNLTVQYRLQPTLAVRPGMCFRPDAISRSFRISTACRQSTPISIPFSAARSKASSLAIVRLTRISGRMPVTLQRKGIAITTVCRRRSKSDLRAV